MIVGPKDGASIFEQTEREHTSSDSRQAEQTHVKSNQYTQCPQYSLNTLLYVR